MLLSNAISLIKLLFVKDKELYVFIHRITGYYPRNIKLYQLAMVHRSKPVKQPDGRWANNERLEYLGDLNPLLGATARNMLIFTLLCSNFVSQI